VDKNTIVLNGKRYDATTGKLLGPVSSQALHPNKHHVHPTTHVRSADTLRHALKPVHPTTPHPKKVALRAQHTSAQSLQPRKPEPAKTLMRHVVKKPTHPQHPHLKKQYPVALKATDGVIQPKLSAKNIDGMRLAKAKQVAKSPHVGKFQPAGAAPIRPHMKPLAVAKSPEIITHVSAPIAEPKPTNVFEQALAQATSHEQPFHEAKRHRKHKHRKLFQSLAVMVAVLVLGGLVAFFNKSSIEVQLASVKAGFQASMPSYEPAGFKRGATETKAGKVAINFVSPATNSSFTLTQKTSDWDSQTLFDNVVAQSNSYQTVQSNGRTIYLYGNNAAWVDGGILYEINGNAPLSSDDVSSIASSM
jgi:hypothetical protein